MLKCHTEETAVFLSQVQCVKFVVPLLLNIAKSSAKPLTHNVYSFNEDVIEKMPRLRGCHPKETALLLFSFY